MSEQKHMTCPHCGSNLACSYFHAGRVVQCEHCGLRGPASPSADDDVYVPIALFFRHCLVNKDLLEACQLLLMCSLPTDVSGRAMVAKALAAIAKAKPKTEGESP